MRVLVVTNAGPACGVAQFGEQLVGALRGAGHEVTKWYADYPTYLPELPDGTKQFDVIQVNFHPGTLGHIQQQNIPRGPLLSVHWHEWSDRWGTADPAPSLWMENGVHTCSDPEVSGAEFWPLPVPEVRPSTGPDLDGPVRIGWTGLRGDGLDWIRPICAKRGWELDTPKGWLPIEAEVDRLAACHLNVVHSHSAFSGMSSAAMVAIAARRPLLINSGKMLKAVDALAGDQLYHDDDFEKGVDRVLNHLKHGIEVRPLRFAEEFSWSKRIGTLTALWERALCR